MSYQPLYYLELPKCSNNTIPNVNGDDTTDHVHANDLSVSVSGYTTSLSFLPYVQLLGINSIYN